MKRTLSVVMVIVMLIALSTTAFAAGGSPVAQVPVMDSKVVTGEGTTASGETVTVSEWKAEDLPADAPFKTENEAVNDALKSEAFDELLKKLDKTLEDFTGSSLLGLSIGNSSDADEVTVVLLYDKDNNPAAGLYFYDGAWREVEVEETPNSTDGNYKLVLVLDDEDKGLDAEIPVTIEDKAE